MRGLDLLHRILAPALAAALLVPSSLAFGQQEGARRCSVPREENGLIRGDRVPAGCVLVDSESDEASAKRAKGAVVVPDGAVFFTPTPSIVVLLRDGAPLPDGKLLPRDPGRAEGARDVPAAASRFGPLQRHFGPLERHFGPLQRHFGPLEREFGVRPPQRKPPPEPNGGR